MNLERLLELVFSNPDNISIEYSNVDGQERLTVNGEDLIPSPNETYDDTQVKQIIATYKENIKLLDDCTFVEVMEDIENIINLKELDSLLNQEHLTEDEAESVKGQLAFINTVIHEKLMTKIQNFIELVERF